MIINKFKKINKKKDIYCYKIIPQDFSINLA